MQFLFRSSFITVLAFQLLLSVTVSAVPQFVKSFYHSMDVIPGNSNSTNTTAIVSADVSGTAQGAESVESSSNGTSGYTTSGAGLSRHLNGGKVGISLGAAAIFVSWVL
ncbi:hypothetical protein PILCRDRAFT_824942 [Piloderma croceum F 1598]|uniref:Uncharacterized protein n=1 Tax=Piloderma croceum (strain F 1598) TaxID=765440 RepID=A0A0C3BKT6_PILCF|nr:hypothetical protein PILCRDRAFT_824942 [Piloderma croceum F 1598]